MKQAPAHILQLIEPVVEGLGYECVGIEYNPHPQHGLLRIYIDHEAGVGVADCTKVSHQVSGVMDVEDPVQGNYQLEVSSPGSERPLFKVDHFQQYIGSKVRVNLFKPVDNKRKITGEIVAVDDQLISVQEAGKVFEIPFKSMSKAHLVADYLIK
jgi:ribosome maturation factor RimP